MKILPPSLRQIRKGKGGRLLRRPQQGHPAATVDDFLTAVLSYFGLGQEHQRSRTFSIESDHPEVFAAADRAPTPTEIVLSALASCLTGGVAAIAQHRGIQLRSVRATVEGDIDVQGILGMDPDIRNGFSAIRVSFEIDADASKDDIKALVAQSQRRSAVFDIITNPTNVFVTVN